MIKLRLSFDDTTDLHTIINLLSINYKPIKISKEYSKGEGMKKVYVDLVRK